MASPDWLPEMVPVDPWNSGTFDLLYAVFCRDLRDRSLTYRGFNVWFYPDTEEEGRESIFWHLTTRTDYRQKPPDRYPEPSRCVRLSWIRAMIERCPCATGDVRDFDHEEGDGSIKTYLWLHQDDFVVILKRLPDGRRRLLTAYLLDGSHERDKMRKKWERRLK